MDTKLILIYNYKNSEDSLGDAFILNVPKNKWVNREILTEKFIEDELSYYGDHEEIEEIREWLEHNLEFDWRILDMNAITSKIDEL